MPDCCLTISLISLAVFSKTSFLRPVMYTLAPLTAKLSDIILPIPVPPPVTTATLPSTENRFDNASGEVEVDMMVFVLFLEIVCVALGSAESGCEEPWLIDIDG